MSRSKKVKGIPRDYLAPGATWPDGPLRPGAPPEAVLAWNLSRRFNDAYEVRKKPGTPAELTYKKLAEKAGLSKTTVHNFLEGKTFPDMLTVDRLERVFRVRLWNWEHWPRPDQRT